MTGREGLRAAGDRAGRGAGRRPLHLPAGVRVSSELLAPERPRALLVLAHGAGAGMDHPFMDGLARGLLARGVATFRFDFPFVKARGWPPDPEPVLVEAVRAAVAEGARRLPGVPLFAGGKSLGGRMTATAASQAPLPGVRGLVLVGFPLHPRGKPSAERARLLSAADLPLLVVQGSRDDRGAPGLLRGALEGLGPAAVVHEVEGADHGFHVLKRSGRTDDEAREEVCRAVAGWLRAQAG